MTSCGVRAAFVVLAAALAAASVQAQDTAPSAAAGASLREYFAALEMQDCGAVELLRPGYGRNCEATEEVTVEALDHVGQAGAWEIFKVEGSVKRGGRAPFSLYFPLEERDGRWVIDDEGVAETFDLDAHRIAAEVAGPAVVRTEPPPTRPLAASSANSRAPLPDAPVPAATPQLLDPDQQTVIKLSESTAEARGVIDRFYTALREHHCVDALELRPDYPISKCEAITAVEGPQIVVLDAFEGFELFHIAVTLTLGAEINRFNGYAAVKRRFPDWAIVTDLVLRDVPLDEYKAAVARHLAQTTAGPSSGAVYDPESVLEWGQTGLPPDTIGSATVLGACWPAGALTHRPGEEQSYASGPDTFMGPPERRGRKTGIAPLPPEYRGSIRSVDTRGAPYIALTFDVCEQNNDHAGYDGEIVDYLRAEDVRATFFLGGKWMATHPDRAMQLIADPRFETGNHAWTHGNMRVIGREDPEAVKNQILFTQAQYELLREKLLALAEARGVSEAERASVPAQLATFRYPYGTCSPASLEMANDFGLPAVQWSIVSGDPDRSQSAWDIAQQVLHQVHPGAIVVMHANGRGWNTAEALHILVPALRGQGYRFKTVSELLALGDPVVAETCYEVQPGDNDRCDQIFGRGTGG